MKKKLMSVLTSLVIAIGLSIPAVAQDFGDSSESGDASEITQLVFSKSSYTIPQDQSLDLKKELTAYCGSKKICQYPDYEFTTDDANLVFSVSSDGVVDVFEEKGSATVTVKELTSGKKATCRIVAAKGGAATGFKFEPSSYVLYTDADPDQQEALRVVPTGGSYFTSSQKMDLEDAVKNAFFDDADMNVVMAAGEDEDGALLFRPDSVLTVTNKSGVNVKVSLALRDNSTSKATKSVRVSVKSGNAAQRIARKGTVRLEIGQTADLYDYLSYNSSANYGKDCDFYLELYNDRADTSDYAVLGDDGHTVMGVAVGRLKAVATLRSSSTNASTEIPIEVVAKGSGSSSSSSDSGEMSISPTSGNIRVGGSLLLSAKNIPDDMDVDWDISDDDIASLTISGGKATVKGLETGNVVVTAEVDGEQIGKAKITVSNAVSSDTTSSTDEEDLSGGVVSPSLPDVPIVVNPGTGDSWFSHLL